MIEPWERVESERLDTYKVFEIRADRSRSPQTGEEHTFYVIESPDWINIVPLTPEGQIVFIRQYRHGREEITLEIPGGLVDPGEAPAEAARRELREETGYDAEQIIYLGTVAPNPAIQDNLCHLYLARDVHRDGPQRLDGTEEIAVELVDAADVPGLIVSGVITHALVVAAFYFYEQHRRS